MTEKGMVLKIEGEKVTVRCQDEAACKSCGNSLFCSSDRFRIFTAINRNHLEIKVGDLVDIYLAPAKTLAASFSILILPLILFIVFYLISGSIFPHAQEAVKALFGLAGIGMGFLYNLLLKKLRGTSDLPSIDKVLYTSLRGT